MQIPGVAVVKVGVKPEVADAVSVSDAPNSWGPGLAKVSVWSFLTLKVCATRWAAL